MAQLGKCIDDGVELEVQDPVQWIKFSVDHGYGLEQTLKFVEEGRIRTKPRTLDVIVFQNEDGSPHSVAFADAFADQILSKHFTHTIPLDGESGDSS